MSLFPYTSVHDLHDIAMIYRDCKDYKISVWYYKEQRFLDLYVVGLEQTPLRPVLKLTSNSNTPGVKPLKYVSDLIEITKRYQDDSYPDEAEIILDDNKTIVFCGSSNPDKQVNYVVYEKNN